MADHTINELYLRRVENGRGALRQNEMMFEHDRFCYEICGEINLQLLADHGFLKPVFLRLLILIFFFLFSLFHFLAQVAFPIAVEFRLILIYTQNSRDIFFVEFEGRIDK